jgi:hypothetical protein
VNLNWKLASAFATGALLASGIVYVAVKPDEIRTGEVRRAESPKPEATPAVETNTIAPLPAEAPAPAPTPHAVAHLPEPIRRAPVREKPSPMPPPVRHQQEALIAINTPSIHTPAPAAPPVAEAPPSPPPAPVPAASPAPPENVPVQNVSLPAPAPAPAVDARVPHTVTLAAGTMLPVRIGEALSSARNQPGDTFLATLTQPLVIDGWVIAERGARVEGRVIDATPAGRVKGVSHLGISIVRLATADGQNIRIRTEQYVKDGPTSTGTDAAKIGGGAALGAIIGAIVGGGKGAGIGAGAGGAAGAGDVLLTRGKPAEIPVEARVSFRVQDAVTITERLE